VIGLVMVSLIWDVSDRVEPATDDLTFEDVRTGSIPAMTSWVRIEGDLRTVPNSDSLYELHDHRGAVAVLIVTLTRRCRLGHQVMTGQISPTAGETTGNIGSLEADIPAAPARSGTCRSRSSGLPAGLAAMILLGRRLGYPIVRRERRPPVHGPPLGSGRRF
jgi:hypothetical protein